MELQALFQIISQFNNISKQSLARHGDYKRWTQDPRIQNHRMVMAEMQAYQAYERLKRNLAVHKLLSILYWS